MGENAKKERTVRLPNVFEAILPILVMMVLMIYGFVGGGDYTDAHMPLVISIAVACIIGGICAETCTVTKDGEPVLLTPTEYKLLSVLMRSPGRIFTRFQLSEANNG